MAFLLPLAGVLGGAALGGLLGGGKETTETREVASDCSWIERSYAQYEEQYRALEAKLQQCDANSPEVERQLRELDEKVKAEADEVKNQGRSSTNERIMIEAQMRELKDKLEREIAEMKEQLRTKKERWEVQLAQKETEDANVIKQLQQQLEATRGVNDEKDEEVKNVLAEQQAEHMRVMELKKQEFVEQIESVENKVLPEGPVVEEAREKREVKIFGKVENIAELSGEDLFVMVNDQRNAIQGKGIFCAYHFGEQVLPVSNLELLCNTFSQLS